MRRTMLIVGSLGVLLLCCSPRAELQSGDIVFQNCQSRQAPAIALATNSKYTHVGVVIYEGGSPYVYEAVQPVRKVPLQQWIDRGKGKHYVAKRLKDTAGLDAAALRRELQPMLGKNYDARFEWGDERIYCSELVWKAYQRGLGIQLSELKQLGDFDLSSPVVERILKERYGKQVPLRMKLVAPSDLYRSDQLRTVKS